MGKVVDALIEGTPLGKLAWDAIGVDAWWEVSVGKYVRDALIPIPDDDFGNEAMSQQQMLRSPTEARRSIYGKAMVSGPIVFVEETGTDNEFLHLVIPLAAHQCDAVLEIYFDDERVYQNGSLDAAYNEHARINIHLGAQTAADSDLLAECEHWTASHIGLGITYLYVRLKHDPEFYANGLPNIKALVQGKPLYDPRKDSTVGGSGSHRWDDVSTWEWSDNWALCVLDYTRFESGVGALANEIDLPSYALAANDSDQLVEYDDEGNTEKGYTCNGTFTQSMTPASVLDKLLTAGAGMQTYSSGKYQLFSGVYQGPHLLTLGEADLAGEVEVRPFNARAQLCNAVRGTFVDPENFYQPTDFSPYESDYYRAQDNGEYIDHDIDLPFTQSAYTAQRLAKLYLELNRAGQQIVVPLNMIGLSVSVGQVIELDLPRLGIKAEYQVMDWLFDFGQPIKVTLRETAVALFDYDKGSYTDRKLTPVLNLPSSKRVPTVGGVVWTPLGDDANWQGLLSWSAPGGNSAYRYRLEVSDAQGAVVYQATIDATQHHIPKLDAGNYTVTLWAVNLFANRSNVPATIAIGADAPPTVTGILVDAGALELTLRPQTAAITATTTEFEVKGGLSSDIANALFIGQGKEVIWPSRHANTQYFVWARATNNYGFSAWFGPIIAHTNSDKSALVELLGDTFEKFTWFAWADDNQGTGFTTNEAIGDGKPYMGIATDKKTASPSGNWQDYTWTKIKTEIPPVFTPEEETKLDNLMAGKFPNDASKQMLALQDALNNPQLSNDLLTAQKLLNQGIAASDLGGETPAAAQAKANLAEVKAKAHADNVVTAEETRAIADAQAKADEARSDSISYTDSVSESGVLYTFDESAMDTMPPGAPVAKGWSVTGRQDHYSPWSKLIPVRRGETLYCEIWALNTSGVNVRAYMGLERYDRNKKAITSNSGCSYGGLSNTAISSQWTLYKGVFTMPTSHVSYGGSDGAEVCYVRIRILLNYYTAGQAYFSGFRLYRHDKALLDEQAQAKADAAREAAEAYALAKANLAEVKAKAHADNVVTVEETRAIADAQAKADAAKTAAISTAAADATSKANAAKSQAISTAASDATSKANAAKSYASGQASTARATAEANAALDALNKANAAKSEAISQSQSSLDLRIPQGNADGLTSVLGIGLPYTRDIVVGGDSNKFYPVIISGGSQDLHRTINIWRSFNESGPDDWNIPTHKGSLNLKWKGNFGGWGGAVYKEHIEENTSAYTTLLADCYRVVHSMRYCFMLRGGGAKYHIASDLGFTANVYHNQELIYDSSNNSYDRYAPAPVTSVNYERLNLLLMGNVTMGNLLAYSGQFNSLQARLAHFNGLTANSIAANAIATNHLTAGVVTADKLTVDNATITKLTATSGLFSHLQARLAAFGGLTANSISSLAIATQHLAAGAVTSDKLTVNNAFIQKLFANSALFGQLQAQIASFGGLAANSIAAKAITVDKLDVRARNLVNNFSQSGESTGWSGFPIVSHTHKGKPTKAMQVSSSGNTAGYSDFFEIDHTKIYEVNFTIHRVSGGSIGSRYFGMLAGGADTSVKYVNPDSRAVGGSTTNFYFWSGDIADGQSRQMRCYIIGSEVDPASIPDSLNVSSNCFLNPSVTHVLLRALNYYNDGVTTVDRWLNPSVTELGGGQISANQLLANSALFNTLKSKLASFGGLTANEIKADTALINKLVGTSGLFNDLVARLAVFGGLTANSIASDAILGRHIKAGEKIESPVIEGGELRLIGSAYMKVQAASPFGPDGLVEWYGPKLLSGSNPNWNALRKSNAITYLAANGDAYFGGSLSAGVLKTGVSNPDKGLYAASSYPVTIGPFGTNGKAKNIVVSYSLSADSTTSSGSSVSNKALSWQLQRSIGNGSWVTVSSGVFTINVTKTYEPEFRHYEIREYGNGSSTYTDNSTSTSDFQYRVKVVSATRYHVVSQISSQSISLISTEQ